MSRKLKKATSADDAFPKKFNNIHYERVEKYLKKVYDFLLFRISSFNSVCSNLELQLEVISSPKNWKQVSSKIDYSQYLTMSPGMPLRCKNTDTPRLRIQDLKGILTCKPNGMNQDLSICSDDLSQSCPNTPCSPGYSSRVQSSFLSKTALKVKTTKLDGSSKRRSGKKNKVIRSKERMKGSIFDRFKSWWCITSHY